MRAGLLSDTKLFFLVYDAHVRPCNSIVTLFGDNSSSARILFTGTLNLGTNSKKWRGMCPIRTPPKAQCADKYAYSLKMSLLL